MRKARGVRDLEDLDAVFEALAHRSRRTILSILDARGGEMTSGAIAARFDHTWPTTTRHLRVLEDAGLVRVVLRGRERVYQLDKVGQEKARDFAGQKVKVTGRLVGKTIRVTAIEGWILDVGCSMFSASK